MNVVKKVFIVFFVLLISNTGKAAESVQDQETLNQSLRREAMAGVIPRIEQWVRSGADLNGKAPHGETALEYAIRFGRYGAALRLIQLGADPNSEDDSGRGPLIWAAAECNASRVVEALLKAGANVNHKDLNGRTALINASHADCVRTVAVILLRGGNKIDIDAGDDSLLTASDVAQNGLIPHMLELARERQRHRRGNAEALSESFK